MRLWEVYVYEGSEDSEPVGLGLIEAETGEAAVVRGNAALASGKIEGAPADARFELKGPACEAHILLGVIGIIPFMAAEANEDDVLDAEVLTPRQPYVH